MTSSHLAFPLPGTNALSLDGNQRPTIPLRSLAHLMARRTILSNVTDAPISLAQFNYLMAEFAPQPLKQGCLMHRAATALYDPLNAERTPNGFMSFDIDNPDRRPSYVAWLPYGPKNGYAEIEKLVALTTNSIVNQLSSHGNPALPVLPLRRRIKPMSPDQAAMEWAEAMESLLELQHANSRNY